MSTSFTFEAATEAIGAGGLHVIAKSGTFRRVSNRLGPSVCVCAIPVDVKLRETKSLHTIGAHMMASIKLLYSLPVRGKIAENKKSFFAVVRSCFPQELIPISLKLKSYV